MVKICFLKIYYLGIKYIESRKILVIKNYDSMNSADIIIKKLKGLKNNPFQTKLLD